MTDPRLSTSPPRPPVRPATVLSATNIHKAFGNSRVLRGVSLEVPAAERVALTGPSGSGKTTFLNCLGGIDRPDQGQIALRGQLLTELSPEALSQVRRRHVGTVFQFFHLLPTLTAFENVELPLQLLGVPHRERTERVQAMLERVNIAGRVKALPGEMSGGEMQRVAIARALIHQPDIILADEPTGNLDSANGRLVLELLRELTEATRTALVLVTHSDEAASICHRVVHLRDGVIEHS